MDIKIVYMDDCECLYINNALVLEDHRLDVLQVLDVVGLNVQYFGLTDRKNKAVTYDSVPDNFTEFEPEDFEYNGKNGLRKD